MRDKIPPYFFWSVWRQFSTWERLFLLVLCVVIVYALYSAVITVSRVRSEIADVERTFLGLRKRSMRLQRLTGAAFYLFGIVLFLSLQWAYVTIDNSKTPGGWLILENFAIHFVFAFNVFIGFMVLHVLWWFVANQVDDFGLRVSQITGD
jgi:di/tricarboxylate transporter